jgi:hypothetical protein
MNYENSWTQPGEGFVNIQEAVANVVVTGLRSSDAKKLAKWLPDLLKIERKNKKFSSKSRGVEKRVKLKGKNVFIINPGSGTDTFHIEQMIKRQLKDWKMRGKVGSSTHVQR